MYNRNHKSCRVSKVGSIIRVFILIILITSFNLFAFTAKADGPPCSFSGTVKLDSSDPSGRILVTAEIQGDEYNTYATESYGIPRYYYLTIRAPEGKTYSDGSIVTFKINGRDIGQIGTFKAGVNTRLDLNASSAATSYPWLTLLLVILLLTAISIACYLVFRLVIKKRKLGKVTVVEKDMIWDAPRAPYVWDNDKLAWVKDGRATNTESSDRRSEKPNSNTLKSVKEN